MFTTLTRTAIGFALVLLVVGCSGEATASASAQATAPSLAPTSTPTPSATPTPTPLPTSTPSPSPTPISRESVGEAFLDILDASNKIVCEENSAFDTNDLEQWKTAARNIADGVRVRTDAVRDLEFPPDLEEMKQSYVAVSATFEQVIRAQSAAATFQEWAALNEAVSEANLASAGAANLLRGELGLPSTPGSCADLGY